LIVSHLEVAGKGRKLASTVHFTSYKAVAGKRRQSRDRKLCHVTSGDISGPEVTAFDWKSPGTGCRMPKTGVYCTFHFPQGCSPQGEVFT